MPMTPSEGRSEAATPDQVNLADERGLALWREHFGATSDQLAEAVRAVGTDPSKVREHLLNQGGSAGVG
jgi:hypothetical protein